MDTFDHIQDIIGQLPILKSYTHVLLCFSLAEEQREPVLQQLETAVRKVVGALPFLSGKVVSEGISDNSSGIFKVQRCPRWESPSHNFVRRNDISSTFASYSQLLSARGPASMLPRQDLGSRPAFPQQYHESEDDPAPVIDVQANLIRGGLLLDIAAQHNIIDAGGIFQIANLMAFAMRGEAFPEEIINEGNRDRRSLIPLIGSDEQLLDHKDLRPPVFISNIPSPTEYRRYQWRYFRFPDAATKNITAEARRLQQDFLPSITHVSVNDALTAFIWQRVTAARLELLNTPEATGKICRAVDLRRVMNISPGYLGHMIRIATTSLPFQEIVGASLSKLASILRQEVHNISSQHALRSYATFIANEPDKSKIAYAGAFDTLTDLTCSSIAHINVPNFGILGSPQMIRRPTYDPSPCTSYIAPSMDGGYEALMCLHEKEYEVLYQDPAWVKYVECIG